ncbi:hypothetical protein DFJ77DRAFT_73352 [Powellomyces hirtus]|nr:hypothetical protein DFJ77DRAFT_73352 [Powellomyces hirtus]
MAVAENRQRYAAPIPFITVALFGTVCFILCLCRVWGGILGQQVTPGRHDRKYVLYIDTRQIIEKKRRERAQTCGGTPPVYHCSQFIDNIYACKWY